jgi:hypothetical protein
MKVKKLMKELQKMPPNADIAMVAHDNRPLEIQGFVNDVELRDFDEIRKNSEESGDDFGIKGKVVILSS